MMMRESEMCGGERWVRQERMEYGLTISSPMAKSSYVSRSISASVMFDVEIV
jgi:hypothetical protein